MIKRIYLDIETAPASDDVLARVKPTFTAPSNYKDEGKIAQSIAEQEQAWRERAALDAATGQVLCVGWLYDGDHEPVILGAKGGTEKNIVGDFWLSVADELGRGNTLIGFNIFGFDLPFMARRAWVHGLQVPHIARNGRYWSNQFMDLMDIWKLGVYDQRISLDNMAKALGVGAKTGSGKDFAALWATDKPKALEYLVTDLRLTKACADRLLGNEL